MPWHCGGRDADRERTEHCLGEHTENREQSTEMMSIWSVTPNS